MPIAAALILCFAIDGDTLRCGPGGKERVRLIGIDAPEMPGHCRMGRACAPGDPWRAKRNLTFLVQGRKIQLQRHGQDAYGRTLAFAFAGGQNLSCQQLRGGFAVYVARWDFGGQIGRCR